ncbi:DNA-processing protein DprA [Nocardia sp. NPDC004068]|uniref:DNA-processing protein DprA n=1 Tax=Nocardia sp. NPDC004068 TaxID=3364303 RepID=UPI0036BA66E0
MDAINGQGKNRPTSAMSSWNDDDRSALVAMMRLTATRAEWSDLTTRVTEMGSARALWDSEHPRTLFDDEDDAAAVLRQSEADVQAWKRAPFSFHTFMDDSYPERLRSVRQVPPVVFTYGSLVQRDPGVCVVGSRGASEIGIKFAREVARSLAEKEITVVAGLAKGIDTAAHRSALDAGGRTVAVLGNGFNHVYPRENSALQTEIADRGMLLSHFLPEYGPKRYSFPARNVTMSAYGTATVIVEASEKSGTRIQAREAIAHGRPVILNKIVMETTSWGRAMRDEPGVYIAHSASEAVDQSLTIIGQPTAVISQLLDALQ